MVANDPKRGCRDFGDDRFSERTVGVTLSERALGSAALAGEESPHLVPDSRMQA
jgi:hypothetical protein